MTRAHPALPPPRATAARRGRLTALALALGASLAACGGGGGGSSSGSSGGSSSGGTLTGPLASNALTGAIDFIHDPAIARQGDTTYLWSTDASATQGGVIPVRCTTDQVAISDCGFVFKAMPPWVSTVVPLATTVWAPDVSWFGGRWHLYYAVSSFGSNVSAIGHASTPTLDVGSADYGWVDDGAPVLRSAGTAWNAIDPNIVVAGDGSVRLSWGSFWSGIWQQAVDPATGALQAGSSAVHLAQRASTVSGDPVEGAVVVAHGSWYYLFTSWDLCCTSVASAATYKIVVGRSSSPDGPFVDKTGTRLLDGGGSVLLQGNSRYAGPGGQSVLIDPAHGDRISFHALDLNRNGVPVLFIKPLTWVDDWPVIGD